jgi:glycosyltransferase involved in cell wall biosynthesis
VNLAAEPAARLVALIPAYDAAHLIAPVIAGALAHLPVLVVDDGSGDDTSAAARAAGAEVVRQEPNQGKGAALKNGFRLALERGFDAIVTLDADGQHDPAEIPKFVAAHRSGGADLIIGARSFDEMPFVRRVSNTVGTWSFSRALGQPVRDNQSGYRLLSRRLASAMLASAEQGFELEVEMIVTCVKRGWLLDWVPIRTIYGDQGSHISPLRHVVSFFRVVDKTRRAMRAP